MSFLNSAIKFRIAVEKLVLRKSSCQVNLKRYYIDGYQNEKITSVPLNFEQLQEDSFFTF